MGAYELWKQTRTHRDNAEKGQQREVAAYYEAVLEEVQPAALREYLETKAPYFDVDRSVWDDPADHATPEEIAEFLAGLDELRAPSRQEIDALASKLRSVADDVLAKLSRMNYTGDHTHFEVLEDAQFVLNEVLHGRAFPKLERFRCPSLRKKKPNWRCELQLPHDGNHKVVDPVFTWTDEQSLNPPKNYDADPVDRPPRCPHLFIVLAGEKPNVRSQCNLDIGHGEHHEDESGRSWTNPYSEPTANFLADGTDSTPEPTKPTDAQLDKIAAEVFGDGAASNPDPINRPLDTPPRCRATNVSGMQCIKPEHSQLVAHVAENGKAW